MGKTSPPSRLLIQLANDKGPAGFATLDTLADVLRANPGTHMDRAVCTLLAAEAEGTVPLVVAGSGNAARLKLASSPPEAGATILGYAFPREYGGNISVIGLVTAADGGAWIGGQRDDLANQAHLETIANVPTTYISAEVTGGKVTTSTSSSATGDLVVKRAETLFFGASEISSSSGEALNGFWGGVTVHPRLATGPGNPKGDFGMMWVSPRLMYAFDRDTSSADYDYRVTVCVVAPDGSLSTYVQNDPKIKNEAGDGN